MKQLFLLKLMEKLIGNTYSKMLKITLKDIKIYLKTDKSKKYIYIFYTSFIYKIKYANYIFYLNMLYLLIN